MMALVRMACGACNRKWLATPMAARRGCPFCGEEKNTTRETTA